MVSGDDTAIPFGENPVTYTELHAGILGGAVGVLLGLAYASGHETFALMCGIIFAFGATGYTKRRAETPGVRTLRREPWYALGLLVVSWLAVVAVVAVL